MLTKTYTISHADNLTSEPFLYFDIETTGFKKDATILYLIGCGYYKEEAFHMIQWFNDDGISEPEILCAFKTMIQEFIKQTQGTGRLFSFNGEGFDIPYLNRHYELNEIPFQIDLSLSFDLYKYLRPFQIFYDMDHGRQKDWELFLDINREDIYDGGQLIQFYKEYLLKKEEKLLDTLLLHNREDIQGMWALTPLSGYQKLLDDCVIYQDMAYSQKNYSIGQGCLVIQCQLDTPLPKALQVHSSLGSIEGRNDILKISVPVMEGTLKYFFPDYQNYFYLPEEDRAVHKTIGCYVEKNHREKAKASNCYVKKTAIFLPFPSSVRYYGIEIASDSYKNELILYKTDYNEKQYYAEFDQVFDPDFGWLSRYLSDWMKEVMICNLRERD